MPFFYTDTMSVFLFYFLITFGTWKEVHTKELLLKHSMKWKKMEKKLAC